MLETLKFFLSLWKMCGMFQGCIKSATSNTFKANVPKCLKSKANNKINSRRKPQQLLASGFFSTNCLYMVELNAFRRMPLSYNERYTFVHRIIEIESKMKKTKTLK